MAWTPKTPSTIPYIIAGPILRKVTPTSVSVFIVTKGSSDVTLNIYLHGTAIVLMTGTATPIRLGAAVYSTVVQANLVSGTPNLTPEKTYGYNLYWGDQHLGSDDILVLGPGSTSSISIDFPDNDFPLGISGASLSLPTFVIPPANISDLWILQGSCRKPHGQDFDAMEGVYTIINKALTAPSPPSPSYVRPHMLFLTGDQIYADDVSDVLLQMIIETATSLMDWDEDINPPIIAPHVAGSTETFNLQDKLNDYVPRKYAKNYGALDLKNCLKPGLRGIYAQNAAKVSCDDYEVCKSHLLKFREFAMMYLFVWSDILWDATSSGISPMNFPDYGDAKKIIPAGGGTEFSVDEYVPYKDIISEDIPYTVSPSQVITDLETGLGYLIDDVKLWTKDEISLGDFYSTIKNVRKSLANIPVYMILDDHEITDDLFYNFEWNQNVIGGLPGGDTIANPYGRQLLMNGMTAFAIFQAWGNTPERFMSGTNGGKVLQYIQNVGNGTDVDLNWGKLQDALLPIIGSETLSDVGTLPTYDINIGSLTSIDWSYRYTYDGLPFEVIALDTRTMRAYRQGDTGHSALMGDTAIAHQIIGDGVDTKDLTIIISPTSFLSNKAVEESIRNLRAKGLGTLLHIIPSATNSDTPNHPIEADDDAEQWHQDNLFLHTIIFKLLGRTPSSSTGLTSTGPRVICLTGDVHYSFNKRLELFIRNPYRITSAATTLVMACLCASSFKNQDFKTLAAEWINRLEGDDDDDNIDTYYGYGRNNYALDIIHDPTHSSHTNSQSPTIFKYGTLPSTYLTDLWDWLLKTELIFKDFLPYVPGDFDYIEKVLDELQTNWSKDRYSQPVIGCNNMGELRFEWGADSKKVVHGIWFRDKPTSDSTFVTPNPMKLQYTFQISLDFNSPPLF